MSKTKCAWGIWNSLDILNHIKDIMYVENKAKRIKSHLSSIESALYLNVGCKNKITGLMTQHTTAAAERVECWKDVTYKYNYSQYNTDWESSGKFQSSEKLHFDLGIPCLGGWLKCDGSSCSQIWALCTNGLIRVSALILNCRFAFPCAGAELLLDSEQ